ncbi:MAG: arsenite methyltransferase [Dehalococcoidales bacterium]|jgi:SAM-dependent methyltransferase
MKDTEIRQSVRENYGKIAKESGSCCKPKSKTQSCCNTNDTASAREASKNIGYSEADMDSVPDGANLGLGCGNPIALASLKEGETVLDLGSGAGFDCFLAANRVGKKGKVIGVDMTAEMLEKARENARKDNFTNVEFRLGEIEALPVADNTVDVIISNCVINLSTDKPRVFREAYRALKPGGRLMVSDIVLTKELPEDIRNSVEAYVSCVGGAITEAEYLGAIEAAGFTDVRVKDTAAFGTEALETNPTAVSLAESSGLPMDRIKELAGGILSIKVSAVKPK